MAHDAHELVHTRFLARLARTRDGRAFMLAVCDHDKRALGRVLEMLALVPGVLGKLIAGYRAEEAQHHHRLNTQIARQGAQSPLIEPGLQLMPLLDRRLAGLLTRRPRGRLQIARCFLALQVMEARSARQLTAIGSALAATDAEAAEVCAAMVRDELGHRLYCQEIARSYAPDDAFVGRELEVVTARESAVYAELQRLRCGHLLGTEGSGVTGEELREWLQILTDTRLERV
jgi:hypothetical protein